jgi:hypothetical protein
MSNVCEEICEKHYLNFPLQTEEMVYESVLSVWYGKNYILCTYGVHVFYSIT